MDADEGADPRQEAWAALLAAHALIVRQIDADLSAAGVLSMESYDVLLTLCRSPDGRMRLGELADRVLLTRSGVTRLADRLAKAGLLKRQECRSDKRGAYAALTPKGAAELVRTWEVYRESIADHFGGRLADDEAAGLRDVLGRLAAAARGPERVDLTVRGRPVTEPEDPSR